MIYAKVDVKLRDHVRAHTAGPAMSTWLWALLYAREQESDGHVPSVALRLAWSGEKQARRDAEKLVDVGLWERVDDGWRICRYEAKNETADEIAQRRKEARERMNAVRANRQRTNGERAENSSSGYRAAVPGSGSVKRSDPADQDHAREGDTPPEWFTAVVETVQMQTGLKTDNVGARWLAYRASRKRKTWSMNHEDAVGWLSEVLQTAFRNRDTKPENVTGGASARARKELT